MEKQKVFLVTYIGIEASIGKHMYMLSSPLLNSEEAEKEITSSKKALEYSIAKWEVIVDWYKSGHKDYLHSGGVMTCALCEFGSREAEELICEKCIISKETGEADCVGTPYDDYDEVQMLSKEPKEWQEASQKELDFLQGLYDREYPA